MTRVNSRRPSDMTDSSSRPDSNPPSTSTWPPVGASSRRADAEANNCRACGEALTETVRFCSACGAFLASAERVSDPMLGQLLGGRYRITNILGEGGMGVVYEGEQLLGAHRRKVAVKMLRAREVVDDSLVARFRRECSTIALLDHPNTVRVYDFGETAAGELYIVMELVRGRPLSALGRGDDGRVPVDPQRVARLVSQISAALEEAHSHGIVHRDLKPENIFFRETSGTTDLVKLLDFGIARRGGGDHGTALEKITQPGMVLGTPAYMSPEQFTNGSEVDARSDVYSLSVIAYELLTGRLPFEADSPWRWATQHLTETPALMPEVSREIQQVVLGALEKDPSNRPGSARELARQLAAAVSRGGERRGESARTGAPTLAQAHGEVVVKARTELTPVEAFPTAIRKQTPIPSRHVSATAATPAAFTPVSSSPVIPRAPSSSSRPAPRRRSRLVPLLSTLAAGLAVALGSAYALEMTPDDPMAALTPLTQSVDTAPTTVVQAEVPAATVDGLASPSLTQSPQSVPVPQPRATTPKTQPQPPKQGPVLPTPKPQPEAPAEPEQPEQPEEPKIEPRPRIIIPKVPGLPDPKVKLPKLPPKLQPPVLIPKPQAKEPEPAPKPQASQGDAACREAQAAAAAGNISGAAGALQRCMSGGSSSAKNRAQSAVRSAAVSAVRSRAFNGQCAAAQSALNVARATGGGGSAQAIYNRSQCAK